MTKYERPDITVVSGKGQVVIPQSVREKLGLKPKTRLLVYGYEDAVIMKRLVIPDVVEDLKALYKKIEPKIARYRTLSEEEVDEIVQRHRRVRSR